MGAQTQLASMGKKKGKKKKKGPDPEEMEKQKDHRVKLLVEASVQTRIEELAIRMEVQGDVDKMSFNGYRLMRLPEMVSDLVSLRECNLSHNRLREFPEQTYELANLVKLDLSFNVINILPPDISLLTGL